MRAVNLYHRINFFAKVTSRDEYGATSDTYDYTSPTISTRGGIQYLGGNKALENDEKFYGKRMELTVRYRSAINETMRVQVDNETSLYAITYLEVIGRKEGLKLSLEKLDEGLSATFLDPPTGLLVVADPYEYDTILLEWVNNDDDDGILIERSLDGSVWQQIARINKADPAVTTYLDDTLEELTKYYYRIRHFMYSTYSPYAALDYDTTVGDTLYLTDGGKVIRYNIREGALCLDMAVDVDGFAGVENEDWYNIKSYGAV